MSAPISAEPSPGGPPPTGTKIRPPPDTSSRVRPSIAPSRRGTKETRAVSVTTLLRAGRKAESRWLRDHETPAIPSTAAATSTVTRRVETLRTVIRRTPSSPARRRRRSRPPPDLRSPRRRSLPPQSTTPAPCAAVGLSGSRCRRADETPFNAAASSPGRICASTAAAPPASAAAALEPLIVPYRADRSAFLPDRRSPARRRRSRPPA